MSIVDAYTALGDSNLRLEKISLSGSAEICSFVKQSRLGPRSDNRRVG